MNKKLTKVIFLLLLAICLTGCVRTSNQPENSSHAADTPSVNEQMDHLLGTDDTSVSPDTDTTDTAETTETAEVIETTVQDAQPEHSPLYIPGLCVEDLIRYFNEVCLDAEIVNSGDASRLQKWTVPIYYMLNGAYTEEDLAAINSFAAWLNTVEGFPGIYETQDYQTANLQIHFCTQQEMLSLMGNNFTNMDGAVTFWYADDEIYNGIICYRTDLNQHLRNSVIREEIYNGLGPIQDTAIRTDSIIFSGYSEPQCLTQIDELILKLLYHPQLVCGMNADECEAVIRQLYY